MAHQQLPLVSVIIAFLNEARFLTEAVESVLQQSYTNWEIVLVDDGSTDESVSLAKAFSTKHPNKIFYFEHEGHQNKGLSASRNAGIQQAKGDLIALLDADDVWLPEKLMNQVLLFQQNPAIGMVAEASDYWYSWGDPARRNFFIPLGAPQDKVYEPGELLQYLYPLGAGAAPCPSGLMFSRLAALNAGGFEEAFTKKYQLYEDQAFLHKMYLREKVYVSSSCNNRYRQRSGSIVQQVKADGQYHSVRKFFLEWLEEYVRREQITDSLTLLLLDKALAEYRHPYRHLFTVTLPGKVERLMHKGMKKLTGN